MRHSGTSWKDRRGTGPVRRGSLFPSVIIYLSLTSVMMAVCGFSMHAMFRADRVDRQVVLLLSSLRRVDQQLRDDQLVGSMTVVSENELRFDSGEEQMILWKCDRSILTRTEQNNESVAHRERFVFPAGTSIRFREEDSSLITVRIEEPSPHAVYPTAGDGGSQSGKQEPIIPDGAAARSNIEIQLYRPALPNPAAQPAGGAL